MKDVLKGLLGWRLICAALLICLAPAAYAADDDKNALKTENGASEPSDAKTPEPAAAPEGASDKDDAGNAGEAGGPGENNDRKGSVRLKDLITDGFLIRTTVFVPADAVTRQTGAVSSDAMVMTLQKETVIAICYYTFKAYVKGGKGLMKIPSCTVYD